MRRDPLLQPGHMFAFFPGKFLRQHLISGSVVASSTDA
jgi:hypothetical protein